MFRMQGLRSPEMRSLLVVNEQFSGKRNAAGGHYGQTLIIKKHPEQLFDFSGTKDFYFIIF